MARVYRKRTSSECWHFAENCSNWPTKDYDERASKPRKGGICPQCLAKTAKKTK